MRVLESPVVDATRPEPGLALRLRTLWRFGRPHTLLGTSVSLCGLFVIAGVEAGSLAAGWPWVLGGTLVAGLCANVFIVGLNQLYDVPIDRINKPDLPLAAGSMRRAEGRRVVLLALALGLALAILQGPLLLLTIAISMGIGALYSVPPVRLKRTALWAAMSIALVRGPIVNLGVYAHFGRALGAGVGIPPVVWALTLFVLLFGVAIALAKDIPDMTGDRRHAIRTLATRLGARSVWGLTRGLLIACYLGMIAAGLAGLVGLSGTGTVVFVGTHLLFLILFLYRSGGVDTADAPSVATAYRFLWGLFYLEYLALPLAVLAA